MKTHFFHFLEAVVALLVGVSLAQAGNPFAFGHVLHVPYVGVHHGHHLDYHDIHFGHHHGHFRYGYGYAYGAFGYPGDFLRGAGEFNQLTSQAAVNLQEARGRSIENDLKATETFFARREANEAFRRAHTSPPLSQEQLAGIAQRMAPDRLTSSQLEPALATIRWPSALQGDEFAELRVKLEELFRQRKAVGAGSNSSVCTAVQEAASDMRQQLQGQVREMSPMDFIAAKKFVDSLAYEARFAPEADGLAAN